jgi:hypothetical protein
VAKVNHQGASTFILFEADVGLSVRNIRFPRSYLKSEWSRIVKGVANAESKASLDEPAE